MQLLCAPDGDVVAVHHATRLSRVVAVLMMVAPGATLLALSTQLSDMDADAQMPATAGGAVLIALGLLAILQQTCTRVIVRKDGIERWGLRGKLWSLRWAEMMELRYRAAKARFRLTARTIIHITISDPAGRRHKLPPNMKGMDVLAERIAEQQTAARFAEARSAIDRGDEVRFGPALILDREKVSARKLFGGYRSCPLHDIENVSVEKGLLRIRQKGKRIAFGAGAIGRIPNVFLFLRLLDSLVARTASMPGRREFSARTSFG